MLVSLMASLLASYALSAQPEAPDFTKPSCTDDKLVCLQIQMATANDSYFWINTLATAEITVTLEVKGENTVEHLPLSATETLTPGQKRNFLTLHHAPGAPPIEIESKFSWGWGNNTAVHDNATIYYLPYAVGKAYPIAQSYNGDSTHSGDGVYALDFAMPEGTPIRAAREGLVIAIQDANTEGGLTEAFRDKANYVTVRHGDKTIAVYAHLKHKGVAVKNGQFVNAGDLLGYSGNTGFSSGPHLHLETYRRIDGGRRLTIPMSFVTAEYPRVILERGKIYKALK